MVPMTLPSAFKGSIATVLSLAVLGCSGGESAGGTAGSGGRDTATIPASTSLVLPGLGFVASSFSFYYPDDPETSLDGFDLDGRVSSMDSPEADECAHDDWVGPGGEPGIDYGFLQIINNEETRQDGKYVFGGFRKDQLVDGVIGGAVKNGSMTILLQVQGLDDPRNDDDVVVQIFGSEDSPALGTDKSILPGATLGIHPDARFHSGEVQGAVVDGVLTAGPIDLLFPVDIMIVQDELLIHDSWLRVELADGTFQGTVSGFWDVSNIRDIIGVPTTDNGNAANFTIEQFDAAMAAFADGDYDAESGRCNSFSIMFEFGGLQAFIVSEGGAGDAGGTCGPGEPGGVPTVVDQCVNGPDQAAVAALATADLSGPAALGKMAQDCTTSACGAEVAGVLSGSSEEARNAFGDCLAKCMADRTGLSLGCTGCYGSIAACSTGCCLAPCLPPNSGSAECANCALSHCIDVNDCTGLY
jgi:hypothetical protein